ncbi:hypothetical protein Ocin01_02434 [Orchesella cincta]|uniref:Uncharacterized protein n=1 Tax=Orchesella cincta TaxID=48709 RepID=A0A1D2NG51_ORCCI|nr:hypothetical protein Ocin01_02434 [Orchesella cincta]
MGSEVSRNTNFSDNRVYATDYPSSFAEKAEMHWKKPSRLELFSEDFYCPLIFEAEAKCNVSFPSPASPLSLMTDSVQEDRHQKSVSQSSQENILNNEVVDENCNIIQNVAIHVQEPEDHNYTSEEQEEIDLKVENAIIASDPDVALELEVKADLAEAWTNTSQPHLQDAASGNSQVLMVESAAGTSQPRMIECGIQTSQDFGLRTLQEDHGQSPKRKLHSTSTATRNVMLPLFCPDCRYKSLDRKCQ